MTTAAELIAMSKKDAVALIKRQLVENDRWILRACVLVYKYQTAEEQAYDSTIADNGVGFSGSDAEILSSFAKQILAFVPNGHWRSPMSPKQMAILRRKMPKYARQILRIVSKQQ